MARMSKSISDPGPVHDSINPEHYQGREGTDVQCIDAIEAAMSEPGFQDFLRGQVLKYIWRAPYKGDALQDAKKARWYLSKLIEKLEA